MKTRAFAGVLTLNSFVVSADAQTRRLAVERNESSGKPTLVARTYDSGFPHIPSGRYCDHGAIFFSHGQRPSYVNGIVVGHDGTVYSLSRINESERTRADLFSVSIPSPPKNP